MCCGWNEVISNCPSPWKSVAQFSPSLLTIVAEFFLHGIFSGKNFPVLNPPPPPPVQGLPSFTALTTASWTASQGLRSHPVCNGHLPHVIQVKPPSLRGQPGEQRALLSF